MKKLREIVESKEQPLYNEYDIKSYFSICLDRWMQNMRNFNIMYMDNYQIIQACKQCEIVLYLVDKFADDISLHFYSAESEADRKKYGSYMTTEDSIYRVFKVVEQLAKLDMNNGIVGSSIEQQVDVEAEVAELKKRFNTLVKKCNDAWHKKQEQIQKAYSDKAVGVGTPVPCDCDCECACGC